MSREEKNKYWKLVYKFLGISISLSQIYKYFTDQLSLTIGEGIVCLLAVTLVFAPLLMPKLLRAVIGKFSNNKCNKDAN